MLCFYVAKIPAVLLVIGGGKGTLKTIYNSCTGKDPIHVIVVQGSGGIADVLFYAKENRKEIMKVRIHDGLKDEIEKKKVTRKTDTEEKVHEVYTMILECMNQDKM